jgi:hypothetical protein
MGTEREERREEQQEPEPGRSRPSAAGIYERVKADAAEELARGPLALAFSGLLAGGTVGFSGLAAAAAAAASGAAHPRLIAALVYPLGFVATIIGRAQLFTENTLYPVTLVLDHPRALPKTLRLWLIVYVTNVLGAFLFALLIADSGAVPHGVLVELTRTASRLAGRPWTDLFWSGLLAGWLRPGASRRGVSERGRYSVTENSQIATASMITPRPMTTATSTPVGTCQPHQLTPESSARWASGETFRWSNTSRRIGSTA